MQRRINRVGLITQARRTGYAALFLVTACSGGSTAPSSTATGSYELSAYNGQALPVVLREIVSNPTTPGGASSSCEDRLDSMTLVLGQAGQFTRTRDRSLVCDAGAVEEVIHDTEEGVYAVKGDSVTLMFEEVNGRVTVAAGTRTATSLTITKQVSMSANGTVTDQSRLEFLRTS